MVPGFPGRFTPYVNSIPGTCILINDKGPVLESRHCLLHVSSREITCSDIDATSILKVSYIFHFVNM